MEIVNVIFEKYGGAQMARIFRNYLLLAVVLKELMFSLFIVPQDLPGPDPLPNDDTHVYGKSDPATSSANDSGLLNIFQLLPTLSENRKTGLTKSFNSINNSLP